MGERNSDSASRTAPVFSIYARSSQWLQEESRILYWKLESGSIGMNLLIWRTMQTNTQSPLQSMLIFKYTFKPFLMLGILADRGLADVQLFLVNKPD